MKELKKKILKESDSVSSIMDLKTIKLPKPAPGNESSVFSALKKRKTVREISDKKISIQLLSNLLWAACGVNRKTGPFGISGRTSATASNSQEIDLYVAVQEGIYFYDPAKHSLIPKVAGDLRPLAIGEGQLNFGDKAPLRLIFVADLHKLINTAGYKEPGLLDPEIQKSYYFVDTGIIASNIYLYATSLGLVAWFHNCNKPRLREKLNLRSDQKVLFGQTIGCPVR
jgi:SagB-type dehydrogenase family enzyme